MEVLKEIILGFRNTFCNMVSGQVSPKDEKFSFLVLIHVSRVESVKK